MLLYSVQSIVTLFVSVYKSHLKDHLYETAEKMGIVKEEQAKWVKSRVKAISGGDVEKILQELKEEYEGNSNKRLKIGYIERFYDAINLCPQIAVGI